MRPGVDCQACATIQVLLVTNEDTRKRLASIRTGEKIIYPTIRPLLFFEHRPPVKGRYDSWIDPGLQCHPIREIEGGGIIDCNPVAGAIEGQRLAKLALGG